MGVITETFDGRLYLGGTRKDGTRREPVVDPYRGAAFAEAHQASPEDVEAAVRIAAKAQRELVRMPLHKRVAALRRISELLERDRESLATTISRQTGKPLRDTQREVSRATFTLGLTASAAEALAGEIVPADAIPGGEGLLGLVHREPLGVVAAITPFNSAINIVTHKLSAALAVGNAVIVKPAPAAPISALQLAGLFSEAGFPPEAISVLPGGPDVARALVAHPDVDGVSFTGSPVAGRAIHEAAGPKRLVLELGGNSPNIVHGDADLDWAAKSLVPGAFTNTGQSCNSVQRILVQRKVAATLREKLVGLAKQLVVGDPLELSTDIGTMVSEEAGRRVEAIIQEAVRTGATLLCGGGRTGALIEPALLSGITATMPIACEEVFGPVALLIEYDDADEAIEIANSTRYGLMSAVFTSSLGIAHRFAREIRAGGVMVNRSSNFRLDHLPFGGVRGSGIGREGARFALEEMTVRKTVVVDFELAGLPHPLARASA